MATTGNRNDAIFRLDLEVIGLTNLKEATAALQRQQEAAARLKPAEQRIILTAEDMAGPVFKKGKTNIEELARATMIAGSNMVKVYREVGAEALAAAAKLETFNRAAALTRVSQAYGLHPADVMAFRQTQLLTSAAITTNERLQRFGSIRSASNQLMLAEGVNRGAQLLGYYGPRQGFGQLAPLLGLARGGITETNAAEASEAIGQAGPDIVQRALRQQVVAGLRLMMARYPGTVYRIAPYGAYKKVREFGPYAPESQNALNLIAAQIEQREISVGQGAGAAPLRTNLANLYRTAGERAFTGARLVYQDEQGRYYPLPPLELTGLARGRFTRDKSGAPIFLPGKEPEEVVTSGPKTSDLRLTDLGPRRPFRALSSREISPYRQLMGPMIPIETSVTDVTPQGPFLGPGQVPWWQFFGQGLGAGVTPSPFLQTYAGLNFAQAFRSGRGLGQRQILPEEFFGQGNLSARAIGLLGAFGKRQIFPSQLQSLLGETQANIGLLVPSLQEQLYLGRPSGTGLTGGYPVLGPEVRAASEFLKERFGAGFRGPQMEGYTYSRIVPFLAQAFGSSTVGARDIFKQLVGAGGAPDPKLVQYGFAEAARREIAAKEELAKAEKIKAIETEKAAKTQQAEASATKKLTEEENAAAAAYFESLSNIRKTGRAVNFLPPGAFTSGGGGIPPKFDESQMLGPTSIAPGAWFGGGGGPPANISTGTPGYGGFGGGGGSAAAGFLSRQFSLGRFGSRFLGLTNFIASAAILYPIATTLFQTIGAANELQQTLTRIQAIYGARSLGDQLTIKQDILRAAESLGEDVNQVAQAAQVFAQSGVGITALGNDLQAAATGAKAFGTNLSEVANYIIAIRESSQGKIQAGTAVDLLASIQRRTNVPALALMQSIQNVTPTLEPFAPGVVPDANLVAAITGRLNLTAGITGAQTAAMLRFVGSQLGNPKQVEKLEKLTGTGFGTTESFGRDLKPFADILNDVAKSYQRLIDTGQSAAAKELVRDFFGARQAAAGTALLKEWDKVLGLASASINAAGEAAALAGPQADTFAAKFNNLKTTMTGFFESFLNFYVGGFTRGLDNMVNGMINSQAKLIAARQEEVNTPGTQAYNLNQMSFFYGEGTVDRSDVGINILKGDITGGLNRSAFGNVPTQRAFGPRAGAMNLFGGLFGKPTEPRGFPGVGEDVNTPPLATGAAQDFLDFMDKASDKVNELTLVWKKLGGTETIAKQELTLYKDALMKFYAVPAGNITPEIQDQMQAAIRGYRSAAMQVGVEESLKQTRTNQQDISRALERAGASATRLQLGGMHRDSRRGDEEDLQNAFKLIDLQTQLEKHELERNTLAEAASIQEKYRGIELAHQLKFLEERYQTAKNILDIENQSAKTNETITRGIDERNRLLREQEQASKKLIESAFKGLQDLPKALEQARFQRRNMLGAGVQAVFGPVAGALASTREQGIVDAFKGSGLAGKLSGTSDIDKQIQNAQNAYNMAARAGTSPEQLKNLAGQVETLKGIKAKQQLYAQAAIFGGEFITGATGGNVQNSEIGGEIGAAAGSFLGPAGTIVGGAVGSLIGGLFGRHKPPPTIGHLQIIAENSREQVRLLENTNKLLQANFVSFNVPTGFRLPAYVPGSFGGIGGLRGAAGGVINSQIAVNVHIGGTNVSADKLGQTVAQAISDHLELESRSSGGYFPRMLYG